MPTADPGARRIADEALLLFASRFSAHAAERLRERMGPDWDVKLGFRSSTTGLGNSPVRAIQDPLELLGLLGGRLLDDALRPPRDDPPRIRRAALALKELRNSWAHMGDFEARDAGATVGATRTLLRAYDLDLAGLDELEAEVAALVAAGGPTVTNRADYLDSLDRRVRWLELAGLSPQVQAPVLREDLTSIFVEPAFSLARSRQDRRRARVVTDELPGLDVESEAVDLSELLEKPRLVLMGPPGAGKSTLLRVVSRKVAFEGVAGKSSLPILVRAAAFGSSLVTEPDLTFRRFLVHRASERWGALFADAIESQDAFVLLDGLDEVGTETDRARVEDRLLDFALDHPSIRVWATSRPFGYRHGRFQGHFDEALIQPLDDKRIKDLVSRWDARMGRAQDDDGTAVPEGLLEDIASDPRLRDLASNPLLLTILYLLALRGGRLPTRRVELYAAATDTLLREWPAHRLGRRLDPGLPRDTPSRRP